MTVSRLVPVDMTALSCQCVIGCGGLGLWGVCVSEHIHIFHGCGYMCVCPCIPQPRDCAHAHVLLVCMTQVNTLCTCMRACDDL